MDPNPNPNPNPDPNPNAGVDAPGVDAPGVDANVDGAQACATAAQAGLLSVRLKLRSQEERRLERPSSPRASKEACREFEP